VIATINQNHRRLGALAVDGFGHRVIHRQPEGRLPAFSGRHARDNLRAVVEAVLGMKLARFAGDALADNAGVFFDEDAHFNSMSISHHDGATGTT
jgi:hypothetical protein